MKYFESYTARYMLVCRAAQENGMHANGVSILTGTTCKTCDFHARIRSFVMTDPNGTKFTVEMP